VEGRDEKRIQHLLFLLICRTARKGRYPFQEISCLTGLGERRKSNAQPRVGSGLIGCRWSAPSASGDETGCYCWLVGQEIENELLAVMTKRLGTFRAKKDLVCMLSLCSARLAETSEAD
jgi:hypothetical protein